MLRGMIEVFKFTFAPFAIFITEIKISATVTGFKPLKKATNIGVFLTDDKVVASIRIIKNEGNTAPSAATIAPILPAIFAPVIIAVFTAKIPGVD